MSSDGSITIRDLRTDGRLFTKEERELLFDILGHANYSVEESKAFSSMYDKVCKL